MKKVLNIIFLWLAWSSLMAQPKIPELWGARVHDETKILSRSFVAGLEQRLALHEDTTTNQIAVLIIPSLEGTSIEQYTIDVVEKWKLGDARNDNGILLFVAVEDRKMRIEVGSGLEGVLPDILCGQIIRHEIAPHFRQGNYEAGIAAGIDAIIKAVGGEYKGTPDRAKEPAERGGSIITTLVIIALIIFLSRGNRRRRRGGWFLGPGGWYGGGWSGRSGGGGWSGGGFSGGGGGFSGGGASGSW